MRSIGKLLSVGLLICGIVSVFGVLYQLISDKEYVFSPDLKIIVGVIAGLTILSFCLRKFKKGILCFISKCSNVALTIALIAFNGLNETVGLWIIEIYIVVLLIALVVSPVVFVKSLMNRKKDENHKKEIDAQKTKDFVEPKDNKTAFLERMIDETKARQKAGAEARLKTEVEAEARRKAEAEAKEATKCFCKYCGDEATNARLLLSHSCFRSPTGKHVLYEGSKKETYYCKYCGERYKTIRLMVAQSCSRRPKANGKYQKHEPAL